MKSSAIWLLAFRLAAPGYHYEFPRDHFNHPEFQTEWWYYTGNLHTSGGRQFGFELTFFRRALKEDEATTGVWDARHLWMAHLALSDIDGRHFYHMERLNRSGPGLAGADLAQNRVWNGNWLANTEKLSAVGDRYTIDLALASTKPPVINGVGGISEKAPGHASHYISLTHIAAKGAITLEGQKNEVDGLVWMDHEFFTEQLAANQVGWDWLSLQMNDNTELMLFRLRRKDGSIDPYSAGTFVDAQGRATHLTSADFRFVPGTEKWGAYPITWTVRVPRLGIDAAVSTRLPQQELSGSKVTSAYWEGAIQAIGTSRSGSLVASGYLEMTGYNGGVPAL